MKLRIIILTMLLWVASLFSQSYLDVIRPFYGMRGASGAENGITPAATVHSNAVLGNPALLSYSEKSFVSTDISIDEVSGVSVYDSQKNESSQEAKLRFNNISYIYPVHVYRGAWVWGFNLQPVNSFSSIQKFIDVDAQAGDEFEYGHLHRSTGNLYALTAGTAFLATMNTSVGLSVSLLTGSNAYQKVYREYDQDDLFSFENYVDSLWFNPKYTGFSARVGLSSELTGAVRFGASLEFPSRIKVNESSGHDEIEWYDDGTKTVLLNDTDPSLDYAVWGPWRLGVGIGFLVNPLEVSVNYRFHSYASSFMKSNLVDSYGMNMDGKIDREISQNVQNVHEFSTAILWSMEPINLSFAVSVENDLLNYRLNNNIRLDSGVEYQFYSGLGITMAFRNTTWQSDLNHLLNSGVERNVEVQNSYSQFQFGLKYFL